MDIYLTDSQAQPRLVPGIIWGTYSDQSVVGEWQTITDTVTVVSEGNSSQGDYLYFTNNGSLNRFRIYFPGGIVPNPNSVLYIDNYRCIEVN